MLHARWKQLRRNLRALVCTWDVLDQSALILRNSLGEFIWIATYITSSEHQKN